MFQKISRNRIKRRMHIHNTVNETVIANTVNDLSRNNCRMIGIETFPLWTHRADLFDELENS